MYHWQDCLIELFTVIIWPRKDSIHTTHHSIRHCVLLIQQNSDEERCRSWVGHLSQSQQSSSWMDDWNWHPVNNAAHNDSLPQSTCTTLAKGKQNSLHCTPSSAANSLQEHLTHNRNAMKLNSVLEKVAKCKQRLVCKVLKV